MSIFTDTAYKAMLAGLEKRQAGASAGSAGPVLTVDNDARLNFVVWADPQVSNYMFAREASFASACKDIARMNGRLDALALAGDITENGFRCEYRMTARLLNEVADKVDHFLFVPGNHDVRMRFFKRQLGVFTDFAASVKNAAVPAAENYFHTARINGYTFIMLGADRSSFESAYIGKRQLNLLNRELAKASLSGKPVFVINHQPLNKHNGLPVTWQTKGDWRGGIGMQSDAVRDLFNLYGNVIYITGHLHYGVSEFSFEDHGAYKCLSVPTVGAGNHGTYSPDAQGYVISVYDDRIVLRARIFGEGEYVPADVPNSRIEIPLSR